MYVLTWKEVDTPQGRSLPVQQGSAHRTSGSDYISPQQQVEAPYPLSATDDRMAGWMTPSCTNMVRSQKGVEKRIAYRNSVGRHFVEGNLEEQAVVQLTGFGQMPSGSLAEMESSDPPSQESTPSPPVS